MAAWKFVGAAVRGPDHEVSGDPCQDSFACKVNGNRVAAAVCDGAGSARFSDVGSRSLCSAVVAALGASREALPSSPAFCDETAERWRALVADAVAEVRKTLESRGDPAADDGVRATLSDFGSTLVAAIAGPEGGLFFHIGDGAAAAMPNSQGWSDCVVSRPENGEFSNETYFFTCNDWRERLRVTPFGPSRLLTLVSDGAMPFTLADRFAGLEPRFMEPVTKFLEDASTQDGEAALAATLNGERARALNGDDKTLLWVSRVQP